MLLARSFFSLTFPKALALPPFSLLQIAGFTDTGDGLVPISVWAYPHTRKLSLPRNVLASQSINVANQVTNTSRVICKDIEPGRKIELQYAKRQVKSFRSFIEGTPKAEIVAFFRDVVHVVEERCQLEDFHMKVRDGKETFRVYVFYGSEKAGLGPLAPGECISCFTDVPLYPGEPTVVAGECILEEFRDQPHVLCRLDAKARSGFVITPVRHVERMSDLNDDELFALWSVAVRALRHAQLPFISMILNHGTYRNVHHLHLKVWVENELYENYQKNWSNHRKQVWGRLRQLSLSRPKQQEECLFFKAYNWCRHGDLCNFLHVSKV